MKIPKIMGYMEKLERVKGTIHGVWDNCTDCGDKIKIIEGYEGRCVCKECKLKTGGTEDESEINHMF